MTLRQANALAAFLIIAWSCPALAWAWGPQGHRTVGAIADRLLTPQAHAAVAVLLADDLDKYGNPSGRSTLEAVSVWADEITRTAAARPKWHYDDAAVCGREPRERYCRDGECNTVQLTRLVAVLGNRQAPARERNEALKWVVHLVGDIHQPLHAADNADHGGNRVAVALDGVRTHGRANLHRVWDTELVQLALHSRNRQQPPADIDALTAEARQMVSEVGQGDPEQWARESNNLAHNVAYHFPAFACNTVPAGIVVLDSDYENQAETVVRERLLLAGGRLANLLNNTLR